MQAELDFGEDPLRRLVRVDTMHPAELVQHQFSGKPGAELRDAFSPTPVQFPVTPFEPSRLRRQACYGGSTLVRRIANTASLQYAYPKMAPANLLFDGDRKLQNSAKLINPLKAILLPNPKS
jgi:hypothetical protein